MPPKQKQQSQAGKFKPLKRPARKAAAVVEVPSSAAVGPDVGRAVEADVGGDATRDGGAADPGGGEGGRASRSRGRGRSRSPRGRGGRGGRGGGRGGRGRGRFVVPAGAAFFTGGMAQRAAAGGAAASATNEGDADVDMDMGGGEEAAAPVAKAAAKTGSSKAARSTAKCAAATAREEAEEEIVAEVWDVDEADLTREAKEKAETQQAKKKASRRRTKADAGDGAPHTAGADEAFTYDSDSSMEGDDGGGFPMPPTQLPFPAPLGQATMYDCQDRPEEEKKSSEGDARVASLPTAPSRTSDPPVKSPFLNLNAASEEEKKKEAEAWFLMKFPTRLPQLDANSTTAASSKRTAVKSEFGAESELGSAHTDAGEGASSRPLGHDDALRHAVPGRYGRIVVRRSGRTELVLGGGESGEPEVRMLVHEGLQCGFRQEAVGVDPAGRTFVALGGVDKSLVVTPDVERAFADN
ncbi:hypothetical protein ACHAXT_007697 [Thalassiosira profunda]